MMREHVPTRYTWDEWGNWGEAAEATSGDQYYYNSTSLRSSLPLFADKIGEDVPMKLEFSAKDFDI